MLVFIDVIITEEIRMSHRIEKYANEPIIFLTINPDYNMVEELAVSNQGVAQLLDQATEKQVYIIHFKNRLTIDEIIMGANRVGRGENSLWHHPNIKAIILITDSAALRVSAQGMSSDTFGNLSVTVVTSVEDALQYARSV